MPCRGQSFRSKKTKNVFFFFTVLNWMATDSIVFYFPWHPAHAINFTRHPAWRDNLKENKKFQNSTGKEQSFPFPCLIEYGTSSSTQKAQMARFFNIENIQITSKNWLIVVFFSFSSMFSFFLSFNCHSLEKPWIIYIFFLFFFLLVGYIKIEK